MIGRNGRLVWFQDDAIIVPDENGTPTYVHGVMLDITELKQLGLIDRIPALAPIQAEGCAPMVLSWRKGLEKAEPVLSPKTRIETLATGDPGRTYVMLRQQVFEMMQSGKSDAEIKQYLVARYNDFVLYDPPLKPGNSLRRGIRSSLAFLLISAASRLTSLGLGGYLSCAKTVC